MRAEVIIFPVMILSCSILSGGEGQVDGLLAKDPLKRQATYRDLQQERTALIAGLLKIVAERDIDRSFNGPLHYAIELLGILRATEAVKPLTEMLSYEPTGFRSEEAAPSEFRHVAAVALSRIGDAAVDSMITVISTSEEKEKRELAGWVLMKIDGKEYALQRLEYLAAKRGAIQRERLLEIKTYLENWKPVFK